jgi:hypothetical protein
LRSETERREAQVLKASGPPTYPHNLYSSKLSACAQVWKPHTVFCCELEAYISTSMGANKEDNAQAKHSTSHLHLGHTPKPKRQSPQGSTRFGRFQCLQRCVREMVWEFLPAKFVWLAKRGEGRGRSESLGARAFERRVI